MAKNPTRDYYNKYAEQWASTKTNSFFHEAQFRIFRQHLKKGASILDIGCAYGIHVPLFLGIGRDLKYEGLDISSSFLKIARARYPQLTFREGDLTDRTSLPKKKYDGFWAAAVLMHVPKESWPLLLENVTHMMRPGAIGYVTLPDSRFTDGSDPRHFTIFEPKELRTQFKEQGWKIVKSGKLPVTRSHSWHWFLVQLP